MIRSIPSLMVARPVGRGFYRSITLDQPASDLTDFPVLFSGTYTYLKTVANSGKVQNANGYDIVFYSDSALTTKLKFERVYWDATTGVVEFWIKVPTLTTASALVIYLAYGNTLITTDQQDAANTWDSNYKGVYHLPDGTTLSVVDSSSNSNTLTNTGSAIAGSGKIDGSVDFGSSNTTKYLRKATDLGIAGNGDITLEGWIKLRTEVVGFYVPFAHSSTSGLDRLFEVYYTGPSAPGYKVYIYEGGNQSSYSQQLGTSNWYHLAVVRNVSGNLATLYIDGVSRATTTLGSTTRGTNTFTIGAGDDATSKMSGFSDETRVSSSVRSGDWIAAEYSNQNDPANFYEVGSEVPT